MKIFLPTWILPMIPTALAFVWAIVPRPSDHGKYNFAAGFRLVLWLFGTLVVWLAWALWQIWLLS